MKARFIWVALLCATACNEDRCPNDPRGLLEDTSPFHSCKNDMLSFVPMDFRLGRGTDDPRDAGAAGASDAGRANGGSSGELGAIFATSALGEPRSVDHLSVFECDGNQAYVSGFIELNPTNDSCRGGSAGLLLCRTNDSGYANFRVLRKQGVDGVTHLCAQSDFGPRAVKSQAASVTISSGMELPGSLGFAFNSPVERSVEAGEWLLPAALKCIAEPQTVDCSDPAPRSVGLRVSALTSPNADGGIGSLVTPARDLLVDVRAVLDSPGDGWLSNSGCDDIRADQVRTSIDAGSQISHLRTQQSDLSALEKQLRSDLGGPADGPPSRCARPISLSAREELRELLVSIRASKPPRGVRFQLAFDYTERFRGDRKGDALFAAFDVLFP